MGTKRALALVAAMGLATLGGPACTAGDAPQPADQSGLLRRMGLVQGNWHSVLTMTDANLSPLAPGGTVPEADARALRARIGVPFETDDCIGDGLDAAGNLVLPGIGIEAGCRFERIVAGDGHLDLAAACGSAATGMASSSRVSADYSPTTMTAHVTTEQRIARNATGFHAEFSVVSRRTGACRPH